MKRFPLPACLAVFLMFGSSCTKTDFVATSVRPILTPVTLPVAPIYLPHIDAIYEEQPGTYSTNIFIAGQHFNLSSHLFIDGSEWIDFGDRQPVGTIPPQNEYAIYYKEDAITENPTGLHVFQIKSGIGNSNPVQFIFTPRFDWESILLRSGQFFELPGANFGNRTLPSSLQVFDVTNGQNRLLPTPTITSWTTQAIDMVPPRYLHSGDPLGFDHSAMTLRIVVTVSGKSNSKIVTYQL